MKQLKEKIESRTLKLGIIGLGYVGLPLACEFALNKVHVTGFDVDVEKIKMITNKKSYISDVASKTVEKVVSENFFTATSDFDLLAEMDAISICVPTPLRKSRDPDMTYIEKAVSAIQKTLRRGQIIILESTTYPGTTEDVILSKLSENGYKVGEDFFLAFSPERVDPGNQIYTTKNTPKVLGGVTQNCTQLGKALYELAIDTVVTVSSTRSAEMVKLLENTFRSVNIGMANEMVLMCEKLGVSSWEVIDAAATKPFGFMPFYPGPGLGGHCIPIDPLYLSWKLKTLNYDARFISLADEVNRMMPHYVVSRLTEILNIHKKCINGSKILVIGMAYKANITDVRESPALDIILLLQKMGAEVSYSDIFVPKIEVNNKIYEHVDLNKQVLSESDCVLIATRHSHLDLSQIIEHAQIIFDTRNAAKGISRPGLYRL